LNLTEHLLLTEVHPPFVIDSMKSREQTASRIREFRIVGQPDTRVDSLSGGNQQRALLSFLPEHLRLLLMEHPTRGLDIESTHWIWTLLLKRCRQGTAILFTSSDLDEILERSDRILVFSGGRVTRLLKTAETSARQLGEMIGGQGI
jgi:general nucleoside transport system ATP-binding protein